VVENLFGLEASGEVALTALIPEGHPVKAGEAFLELRGPPGPVLRLERTALNFLGRLCGIATLTRRFVEELAGLPTVLLDTRKTLPAWRSLEKYAVRAGGAHNHRGSLSDGILLKDNHAGILREAGRGDIREWVDTLRRASQGLFLEVEVDDRNEFLRTLETDVDAILLDNFSTADLRWAVQYRNACDTGRPLLEASGGMRLERLREIAETGVDRISVGALTHSAQVLDIGLDLMQADRL
jgi:nicotinate-nucleotide pyrophosphorylase (carboxylating)